MRICQGEAYGAPKGQGRNMDYLLGMGQFTTRTGAHNIWTQTGSPSHQDPRIRPPPIYRNHHVGSVYISYLGTGNFARSSLRPPAMVCRRGPCRGPALTVCTIGAQTKLRRQEPTNCGVVFQIPPCFGHRSNM